MSDNKPARIATELLTKSMNELARIGVMDADDPRRAERIKQLWRLGELSASLKSERNKLLNQRMDELARKVGGLNPGNSRHAQVVNEILRLSDLVSKIKQNAK